MQELVLIPPGRVLEGDATREAKEAAAGREWELRLTECAPLAFRVAQGVLRNAADAEEVAQEALLRAYRKFDRLREAGHFRSWLVRITFRLALDRWRAARRREQREAAWAMPEHRPAPPSAEELAASREFQGRLERALEELPDKFRMVVLLSAIQGYTLEEVSGMLEVPVGTVKSRLFFARKQLAEKLR